MWLCGNCVCEVLLFPPESLKQQITIVTLSFGFISPENEISVVDRYFTIPRTMNLTLQCCPETTHANTYTHSHARAHTSLVQSTVTNLIARVRHMEWFPLLSWNERSIKLVYNSTFTTEHRCFPLAFTRKTVFGILLTDTQSDMFTSTHHVTCLYKFILFPSFQIRHPLNNLTDLSNESCFTEWMATDLQLVADLP